MALNPIESNVVLKNSCVEIDAKVYSHEQMEYLIVRLREIGKLLSAEPRTSDGLGTEYHENNDQGIIK